MKRICSLIMFLIIITRIQGQVVSGTVKDDQSGENITYATVFIEGTFIGIQTDDEGQFKLDISKAPSMPLTVSALGYETRIINDLHPDSTLNIYLTPKVFEIDKVTIRASEAAKARKAFMKQFKAQFLGQTPNALKCTILNEDDISFDYDEGKGILEAYSENPLEILNKGLGYKVTYFIDRFEYNTKSTALILTGNIRFEENLADTGSPKNAYSRRRASAYSGSRMLFFRSLWNNDADLTRFKILDSHNNEIKYDSLIVQLWDRATQRDKKYLKSCGNFRILYGRTAVASSAVFSKELVGFEVNGYFDVMGLLWNGEMSRKRIADMLPYEYKPDRDH